MRLLNVDSMEFFTFHDASVPKYAVASHRWDPSVEASLADIEERCNTESFGYKKVEGFCAFIRENITDVCWLWIDTCCIDQKSSQEVGEAINSMFKWYQTAAICLAYLADVTSEAVAGKRMDKFRESVWFTRGWTLQELLAPRLVVFLTHQWEIIGHKGSYEPGDCHTLHLSPSLDQTVAEATKIPEAVLNHYERSKALSVKDRLEWMASRKTTKSEDMAYCLLGIFDVHMPVLYGEGEEEARTRLMEAIDRRTWKSKLRDAGVPDIGEALRNKIDQGRQVSVPIATVSTYIERRNLSEQLEQKLGKAYRGSTLAHAVTVTGLGGMGKTQLVLRYIKRYEEDYDTILWLDARSDETVRSSFERCCRALLLPVDTSAGQGLVQDAPPVQAVLQWLRKRPVEQKWLVVVDNADDLSWDISRVIPAGRAGSVIVTSQDSQASRLLGGIGDNVKVDVMEEDEAIDMLQSAVADDLRKDWGDVQTLAKQVVQLLDRLPLAIDLAGARIRAEVQDGQDVKAAICQYLTDFERHQNKLFQNEDLALSSSYKKTVWTVWETSLSSVEAVEKNQPDISPIQFLRFITLLDRANIQHELFRLASRGLETTCQRLGTSLPPWLQKVLAVTVDQEWDDFYYRATLKPLLRFGLIRPINEDWSGLTMHSLVRWRAGHKGNEMEYWWWHVIFSTAACFQQEVETGKVHYRRHMILHLPENARLLESHFETDEGDMSWIWTTIGRIWDSEGRWAESERLYSAAYHMQSKLLGAEHLSTLTSIANLASTYQNQGRWGEAETLEVQVMETQRTVLGAEHPSTLTSMANLASTYLNQGRWGEAEMLDVQVMETRRTVLGAEHPSTLTSMANLASTYWNQGRWGEAETLEVQVMETSRTVLGAEHPSTLTSMANLASTYWNQGRWGEAETLEVQVMETQRTVLGAEHPSTLTSMANLASTYWNQGRWGEAETLFVQVMETQRTVLGAEHPSTLTSMANLASTYLNQGRWGEAETLFVQVMETRRTVLGAEHPSTLTSMANLASTYWNQGRWGEAETLFVQVTKTSRTVLGAEHPSTLTSIANLASTYWNQGRWGEAETLDVQVMETSRTMLGAEHPSTLTSITNLASTYRNQGRWGEAETLFVQVMETRRTVLGAEHPSMLTSMANLASTYRDQGRLGEAEKLLVQVVAGSRKVLGLEHPDTLAAIFYLEVYRKERQQRAIDEIVEAEPKAPETGH